MKIVLLALSIRANNKSDYIQDCFEGNEEHQMFCYSVQFFNKTTHSYLRYVVSFPKGDNFFVIGTKDNNDYAKLNIIYEWPITKNLHELQNFACMCLYYKQCIEKFSIRASLLHNLIKNNMQFKWTTNKNQAFQDLKKRPMLQPLLCQISRDCFKFIAMQVAIALEAFSC